MKVYKLEIMILDFDDVGNDDIINILENTHYPNHCINPHVMDIQNREIKWSDEHPINNPITWREEFKKLFSGNS